MSKRVISAIVALLIAVPLFIIGGIPFKVAIGVVAALSLKEILEMKENRYPEYIKILSFVFLEVIVLLKTEGMYLFYGMSYLSICLLALALFIPTIFSKKEVYSTSDAFRLIGYIIFLGLFYNLLLIIFSENKMLLLYLFLVAALNDTFAMITGKLIGKHKLIPKVSPGKTIEGSLSGTIVGTAIASVFYYNVVTSNINIFLLIAMSLILSILGQLGDLFFSKIKREQNIKDFSNIMPGHGGILDRLDSLNFIVIGYIIIINIINLF